MIVINYLQFQFFFNLSQQYEPVWRFVFISITIIAFILFQKVYKFQTHESFKNIREGTIQDLIYYGLPLAFIFGMIDHGIHPIFDPLCQKYYINHQKFPQKNSRKDRCYTLVRWGFSIIYYFFSSIAAYLILKDTHVWPSILGGFGSCANLYQAYPSMVATTKYMKIYYFLQFGKHFSRAFSHIFIRREGNFYQYALHHTLSMFLILYSYLMNFWYVGITILLIHDLSDFFLILSRSYRQCRNRIQWILQIFYYSTFISWIGTRIVMFSGCCIYYSIVNFFEISQKFKILGNLVFIDILYTPSLFLVIMLVILEILQLFWTYYIGRSFLATSVTSKVSHNYD